MQDRGDSESAAHGHPHTAPSSTRNSYVVNGRPLMLQRTSSLAELAREHKRQREPQNDVRKFYDGDNVEEEPMVLDEPPALFSRYKQPAPEHSNLLFRTGSRLALEAGLEIGEGFEPHKFVHRHTRRPRSQASSAVPSRSGSVAPSRSGSSDSSSDSDSSDRVLHIGRKPRSDTISSDISISEPKWPWRVSHMGWIAPVLGFSAREPASVAEKIRLREKSTGFDPALVLAILVTVLA